VRANRPEGGQQGIWPAGVIGSTIEADMAALPLGMARGFLEG
jgi:hypothetical protein